LFSETVGVFLLDEPWMRILESCPWMRTYCPKLQAKNLWPMACTCLVIIDWILESFLVYFWWRSYGRFWEERI